MNSNCQSVRVSIKKKYPCNALSMKRKNLTLRQLAAMSLNLSKVLQPFSRIALQCSKSEAMQGLSYTGRVGR